MQNVKTIQNNGFIGSHPYNIDSKSRVCVHSEFIDVLDSLYKSEHRSVVTCLGLNRSIAVYPISRYYEFLESIQKESILNKNMRYLLNMILGSASIQTIDSQNRLRLSDELLKHAKISSPKEESDKASRAVYEKGFNDRFEIWAVKEWDSFIENVRDNVDDISHNLSQSLSAGE